ncbi:MAG TPA: hypothetical protein VKX28_19140 [Xanthobacteraceae bacterium]|nr:hypothetical protein [Xanthobacteraceae bacterium]
MRQKRQKLIVWPFFVALFLAAVAYAMAPRWFDQASVWLRDEPVEIANRAVDARLTPAVAEHEVEAALAAGDIDLANSFTALAADRGITIRPDLAERVKAANSGPARAVRNVKRFARGFVVGEPNDGVELAGTALGDLLVFGDVRDATREGVHYVKDEPVDRAVFGLACVGLAITLGTYASDGLAAPARVGLSLVKAARKTGRLGVQMGAWLVRSLRGVVDMAAARRAVTSATFSERGLREAVKLEKAEELLDTMRDVGRVQAKAGTRAALDSLKLSQGPRDLSRFARLAAATGGKTRAIIKLAGRAAIMLGFATLQIASWAFGAVMILLGFLASVRSLTERATLRYCDWRRMRRLRQEIAALTRAAATPAPMPA